MFPDVHREVFGKFWAETGGGKPIESSVRSLSARAVLFFNEPSPKSKVSKAGDQRENNMLFG